jgi:hypothetical protein
MKEQKLRQRGILMGLLASLLFVLPLVFIAACGGKKEVKEVSQASRISQEAFSAVEQLRAAYLKRDFTIIADYSTKEGYREMVDSLKHFDSADLTFTPRWVELDKSKVYVNVSWQGSWKTGKDTFRERGMAVFLFEGTPLKLAKIVRGNPFRYPERP